ncbi:MAG TPA: GNAT family protein [Rhizomicrobium sp.]|jgi:RimJ/RimL family protein N-acetyltransferase
MKAPVLPRPVPDAKILEGRFADLERVDVKRHAKELWRSIGSDEELWKGIPSGPFASEAAFREWLKDRSSRDGQVLYAVRDKKNGNALGVYFLLRIDPLAATCEIGLTYGKGLQRSSAGTEAFYLLANYVLGTLGYRRLEWRTGPENDASNRAALRYGFTREGLLRQTSWTKGGNWDTVYYSIIDGEWPAISGRFQAWLNPRNFDEDGHQIRALSSFS